MTSNQGAPAPTAEARRTTKPALGTPHRTGAVWKFVIPVAIILVIAYVAGIFAFKSSDGSFTISGDDTQVQSGIQVTASMVAIEPASEQLSVRLQFTRVGISPTKFAIQRRTSPSSSTPIRARPPSI